jgi:hypothetical protein
MLKQNALEFFFMDGTNRMFSFPGKSRKRVFTKVRSAFIVA